MTTDLDNPPPPGSDARVGTGASGHAPPTSELMEHPEPAEHAPASGTDAGALDERRHEELAGRLADIDVALRDFHRRAAHREAIIDRLHEENQQLRAGVRRAILEPVVADLVRLYDSLGRQAEHLLADPAKRNLGDLLASYAEDVEMILDRCDIEIVTAVRGEPFEVGLHTAVEVVACDDPKLDNTVAEVVTAGLRDRETGHLRRPAKARFFTFSPPAEPDGEKGDGTPPLPAATDA